MSNGAAAILISFIFGIGVVSLVGGFLLGYFLTGFGVLLIDLFVVGLLILFFIHIRHLEKKEKYADYDDIVFGVIIYSLIFLGSLNFIKLFFYFIK